MRRTEAETAGVRNPRLEKIQDSLFDHMRDSLCDAAVDRYKGAARLLRTDDALATRLRSGGDYYIIGSGIVVDQIAAHFRFYDDGQFHLGEEDDRDYRRRLRLQWWDYFEAESDWLVESEDEFTRRLCSSAVGNRAERSDAEEWLSEFSAARYPLKLGGCLVERPLIINVEELRRQIADGTWPLEV